ncbi:MAG: hypothetical protein VYA58_08370 [Pseudomonadota bacterium]|nr:hypothetical protein [Pseudomonadota bacterium]MEC7492869.1 hypothetical protein [Pseudomonadota bacterium]MEC8746419.1 hypothetical protein [Pseudomonadota bacterium]MEC9215396.1 hypothetical protein [Pseudomonadota bacterium]MED6301622.1 hypothetical protein [Pseudomonadota bacterium]
MSIDRTVIGADSTVRPAELAMMINVRMFIPVLNESLSGSIALW